MAGIRSYLLDRKMENTYRDPILCRAFVSKAKEILSHYHEVKHSWSVDDDEDHCILDIPKQSDSGFNITIEVFSHEIIISADGPHLHFDNVKETAATVEGVLGLVRDLLSPAMRVVEFCSNGKPYKWHLESSLNGQWQREDTTGLFFYNLFGKKTKNIYQNHILPSRI